MEVLLGQRARFYQVDLEGLTLTAGVVGSASGFSTLVGVADSLQPEADGEAATSAREVDRAEFILGLGDVGSSVSTGRYGVTLGSARVYLEIKQDLERLRVARASGRVLSFESDDAFVSFVLLDQLLDPTSLPADDAFVSVNSESDLVAWLEGFGRVSESPALDIRSGSLRAWDLQIDGDDERTFLCQGGAQCMPLLFTDQLAMGGPRHVGGPPGVCARGEPAAPRRDGADAVARRLPDRDRTVVVRDLDHGDRWLTASGRVRPPGACGRGRCRSSHR